VTKDYKKDLDAVDSQASKKGSEADPNDLLAAFSQMGLIRKCQMCTMELVYFKFKKCGGVLTPFDSFGPHNAGEGKWSDYCKTCIPLAEQALLAEREHPSSAKIRMILKLLRDIDQRSESTEKTIIFSQFTSMLDLIEPFLKEKGIRFVRCELLPDWLCDIDTDRALDDGSMAPTDREAALTKIKNNAAIRVILISFKSGNTGKHLGGENVNLTH
jgi:SNF2 family DNA or RNA helicase